MTPQADDFVKVRTWADQTTFRIGYVGNDEFGRFFGLYHPLSLQFVASVREPCLVRATPEDMVEWMGKVTLASGRIQKFLAKYQSNPTQEVEG